MTDHSAIDAPKTGIKNAARAIAAKASPELKTAATAAHEAYDHLKVAAAETLGEARGQLQTVVGGATDQAQQRYDDLEAYVQRRPARALGIAAAAGLLIGLLLRGSGKKVYVRDPR